MLRRHTTAFALLLTTAFLPHCSKSEHVNPSSEASSGASSEERPDILLVTLDTTRVDAIGPEAHGITTPGFNALAAHSMRFRQAYTAVPQTLPAHTSILTGVMPAAHGLHENGRNLSATTPLLAERMHTAGYETAAFVSAFALARRFGLSRGFDLYDDETPQGLAERTSRETTDRAIAWIRQRGSAPSFLWVHYYDPHFPYTPPEPYRSRFAANPYLGEVAAMDEQLGRLVAAFGRGKPVAIIVVGDHGEGLGEHGEAQHGNLLYQATVHVPLLISGPGVKTGTSDVPLSTRHVFHTICDFAGIDSSNSLRHAADEVVMGEAMKPYLDYGWQPQVMALHGRQKTIVAGGTEVYDVVADPNETHNLAANADLPRPVRAALHDYPIPSVAAAAAATPSNDEERKKLASLGYVASTAQPVVRADAPRPADMAALFPILDKAASLFVAGNYAAAIPLLEQILSRDPHNLDAALRLATSYSALGRDAEAYAAFTRAKAIAPQSPDVRVYLALHEARGRDWQKATPELERIVEEFPDKVPSLEALEVIRERQQRFADAIVLRQRIYALRTPTAEELVHLGALAMQTGQTPVALDAFERARTQQGSAFRNDLELGVLYLDARRFTDARDALDRVSATHPAYPMALFKRAQVSVLLHESDSPSRIAAARAHANAMTRELIARERLFQ